VIFLIRYFK